MRRPLAIAALVASLVPPAFAADRLLIAGENDELRLHQTHGALRVEASGATIALPAAAGSAPEVDAFVATGGGWLAVGSAAATRGRELALWVGTREGTAAMAPPAGHGSAIRQGGVPLLRDGSLVGLAWLEGEAQNRLGVWTAAWDGASWGVPRPAAPPARGSQLGLTGTVLADGSWLLAWSAFDGEVDAVVWSQGRGGRWTVPRRVDLPAKVPDITPALRADGDGAVIAWSRYDGKDYRLRLARFAGGRWQDARWAAGAGSVFPVWQDTALLFRDAVGGAWVAATIDAGGRLAVAAAAAGPVEPRPAAMHVGGGLRLVFP